MKFDRLLNMIMRGSMGLVIIYLCNLYLATKGYAYYGAINLVTFLVCAVLGLPGVLLVLLVVIMRSGIGI